MRGIDLRLTGKLRQYDRRLFVYKDDGGQALVMRQGDRLEASDYGQAEEDPSLIHPQLLFALMDDQGKPAEWGIERIMTKLKSMDMWRNDSWLSERKENLKRAEEDRKRQGRNEFRAIAADCRKEFAKATNDINTSTVAKTDRRRLKES